MPNPKVRITKTINAITGKYPILSMLLKVNFKPNMATPIRSTVPEANSIPALQFFSLFKKLNAIPISNANSITGALYWFDKKFDEIAIRATSANPPLTSFNFYLKGRSIRFYYIIIGLM